MIPAVLGTYWRGSNLFHLYTRPNFVEDLCYVLRDSCTDLFVFHCFFNDVNNSMDWIYWGMFISESKLTIWSKFFSFNRLKDNFSNGYEIVGSSCIGVYEFASLEGLPGFRIITTSARVW